ncbi:MAG TPA: T9SS type A sorting domain-containing protein, partial [Flavisolibacter sp.]|nr:T9SS type A sorting domain-containing protein [Flavisolibacter sp.]
AALSWSTAEEVATDRFVIEHSTDGTRFTTVGEVKASGNTGRGNYSFVHAQMANGFNYYRIKQVDVDGKFSYSKVITLLNNAALKELVVGPNPASSVLNIILPAEGSLQRIEIFTAAGAKLKEQAVAPGSGRIVTVNVQSLPAGVYTLQLISKQGTETRLFIKN